MTVKNKIIKLISAFLIISIMLPTVFFFRPQETQAQVDPTSVPTFDKINSDLQKAILKTTVGTEILEGKEWLEYLGKQILKMVAKRILAQMTQATINWINDGFHGSPLFLENPESFFKDIAKAQVRTIVDMIGYDSFRFPFGKQTALNVIASYKSQLATNSQYTLSKVLNDPDLVARYRNDFNYGGWNGFLINTQYPQNNYLGFDMIIRENLASQLEGTFQAPAQKVQSLLQQGMGFLSPQTCADSGGNNEYNKIIANQFRKPSFKSTVVFAPPTVPESDPTYEQKYDQAEITYQNAKNTEKANWTTSNTCQNLVNTTPGFVAATQIANALDSPRMMTVLDGALGNSFAAIFDALLNKLIGDGLNALASTVNPSSEDDNWVYEGQSLGNSPGSFTTSSGGLNINSPLHNISLDATTSTTRTISGGTGDYKFADGTSTKSFVDPGTTITIATVTITPAGVLTIQGGSASGEASVVVKDSPKDPITGESLPPKTTTINIEVNNPAELVTSPRKFTEAFAIKVYDTASARILGGEEPYFKVTNPDQNIAIVNIADNVLFVSGVGPGMDSVIIRDSSNPVKTFKVDITVTESSTLLPGSRETVLIYTDQLLTPVSKNLSFSNGSLVNTRTDIATANIIGSTITFTGLAKGQTIVTVTGPNNSDRNPQSAEFFVTIADKLIATTPGGNPSHRAGICSYYPVTVSGGTGSYFIRSISDPKIVYRLNNGHTYFEGNILWICSLGAKGSADITIGDSGNQTLIIHFIED